MQAGQIKRKMCCNAIGQVLPVTVLRTTQCESHPNGGKNIHKAIRLRPLSFTTIATLRDADLSILRVRIPGTKRPSPFPHRKRCNNPRTVLPQPQIAITTNFIFILSHPSCNPSATPSCCHTTKKEGYRNAAALHRMNDLSD